MNTDHRGRELAERFAELLRAQPPTPLPGTPIEEVARALADIALRALAAPAETENEARHALACARFDAGVETDRELADWIRGQRAEQVAATSLAADGEAPEGERVEKIARQVAPLLFSARPDSEVGPGVRGARDEVRSTVARVLMLVGLTPAPGDGQSAAGSLTALRSKLDEWLAEDGISPYRRTAFVQVQEWLDAYGTASGDDER